MCESYTFKIATTSPRGQRVDFFVWIWTCDILWMQTHLLVYFQMKHLATCFEISQTWRATLQRNSIDGAAKRAPRRREMGHRRNASKRGKLTLESHNNSIISLQNNHNRHSIAAWLNNYVAQMSLGNKKLSAGNKIYCTILLNTLRQRQNGRHFADDIFKCIFFYENAWISLKISLKFVPKVRINNIPALVQIMAWRQPGDKPLSEPMMVSLLTHICVTRPQWVKW